MKGHRGKTALGLLITILLLAWVLRDVSAAEVLQELREANPWLLAAAVGLATFSFVLRAARWRVLLLPRYGGTGFGARFGATCIGFTVNNLLPARLGEVARAYALGRTERLPVSAMIASLIAERVFDGLVLAFFLFATVSSPGFPLGEGAGAVLIRRIANVGVVSFAAAFAALWLMARSHGPTVSLFERLFGRILSPRVLQRSIGVLRSFLAGLGTLGDASLFARALGWSILVWLNLAASIWLGLLAFGITTPGPVGSAFLQALIAFAVALPSSPGFFGPFEASARLGLGVWEIGSARIVSFATSYHILSFIPVTLLGLWYIRRFGLSWEEMGRVEETVEAVPDPLETSAPVTPEEIAPTAAGGERSPG